MAISSEAARERAAVQAYLAQHKVNDMLCSMLETMCIERPPNPHQFVVDWMCTQFPSSIKVTTELSTRAAQQIKPIAEDEEDPAEDDNFETEEKPANGAPDMSLQMAMSLNRNSASRRRSAVSAESVDPAKISSMYERKVHEKSPETRAKLKVKVHDNFLFSTLDPEQLDILLDAMFEKKFAAGETIIKQGDEGDNFYLVFAGECDVYLNKGGSESLVLHCVEGDSFGELALLYNAPRAATVKASSECTLFAVDRFTFKFIMMDTTMSKRKTYEGFLEKVPLLSSLTSNERQTVADALKPVTFKDGEAIIHQNDVRARPSSLTLTPGAPAQPPRKCASNRHGGARDPRCAMSDGRVRLAAAQFPCCAR
jgi:cAMP-dependent protein kinase regulator